MKPRVFENPWWVVVGSFLGLIVSSAPMLTQTIGVLVKPISADVGWSRSQVTLGLALSGITMCLASVILGRLMDQYGVRRVTLPCVIAFAIAMASIGMVPNSLAAFTLMYAVAGMASAGIAPLPYAKSVTGVFDNRRGLALGIAIAGVGMGTALVPQYAQSMVEKFGWRGAYVGLGLLHFVVAFPAVLLLLRDPDQGPSGGRSSNKRGAAAAVVPGKTLSEALVSSTFWFMAMPFIFTGVALSGLSSSFVPILTDAGMSARLATTTLTAVGIALIIGRIGSGYLLDRMFAPYVTIIFLMIPFAGILMFSVQGGALLSFMGAFLIGIGIGGELDLMAYLVSRYFGVRAFGAIYGLLTGGFFITAKGGPFLISKIYEATGSYYYALLGAGALMPLAALSISRLGPYVYKPMREHAEKGQQREVPVPSRP
jgi:MFS family permease